jgi:tocopherol cyclase
MTHHPLKFSLFIILALFSINLYTQNKHIEEFFNTPTYIAGYGLKKTQNTSFFQGNKKKRNYFEGWYFKMASKNGESIISVIPGIALAKKGNEKHAFIQIINGKTNKTYYVTFHIDEFKFSKERFAVQLGQNFFCKDSIILNIQDDSLLLSGKIYMTNQVDLSPNKKNNKKIMGIFRFAPFMQCYHGVVSLDHNLSGSLKLNNQNHEFSLGHGYIEKDWGRSMPSAWIWMQTNSFESENTSFMLSIANIPWMGTHFTGFLGFFLHNNEVHRFGTYKRTRLTINSIKENTIKITIKDKKNTLYITAKQKGFGFLAAPVNGSMDRRIAEGIEASIWLEVHNKKGSIIFNDSTSIAGLEVVGNMQTLLGKKY